jgi:hypothetical protein
MPVRPECLVADGRAVPRTLRDEPASGH